VADIKQYSVILLASVMLSACFSAGPVGNKNVPQPLKPVELERYTGLWYEMARYENGFEKDCFAVTAEYAALPDGKISVLNSCHKGSVDGALKTAGGKAKIVEATENTKLKVSFFGPFYVGDYWVLDHAENYSWSIVGEPSGRYLWILTRDAHPSAKQKAMLYKRAEELGYDLELLKETPQK